jgi:hypothetical protein
VWLIPRRTKDNVEAAKQERELSERRLKDAQRIQVHLHEIIEENHIAGAIIEDILKGYGS